MNASVQNLTASAERRRSSTLRDIGNSFGNAKLDLQTKVPTLGNREAYNALRAARDRLTAELQRMACVEDEFLELAQEEEAAELECPESDGSEQEDRDPFGYRDEAERGIL